MAVKQLFRLAPLLCFWVVVGAKETCYPSDLQAVMVRLKSLATKMADVESQIDNLREQNAALNTTVQQLQANASSLRMKTTGASVAFIARSPLMDDPPLNYPIGFLYEELDTQDRLNHTSGVFTAPVDGTYLFSVQICSSSRYGIYYAIKSSKSPNKVYAASFNSAYDFNQECSSVTTVIGLQQNETVWLEVVKLDLNFKSGYKWGKSEDAWCMFVGVLL